MTPTAYIFWRDNVWSTLGTPQPGVLSHLFGCFLETTAPTEPGLNRSTRKTSVLIRSETKIQAGAEAVKHWFPDFWATQELLRNDNLLTERFIYSAVGILFGSLVGFLMDWHQAISNVLICLFLIPICLPIWFTMNAKMFRKLAKKSRTCEYLANYMVNFLVEAIYLRMCNPGGETAWNKVSLGFTFVNRVLTLPLHGVFMDSVDKRIRERFAQYVYFLDCVYWFLTMRRFQTMEMCDGISSLSIHTGLIQINPRWILAHTSQNLGMSALACLVKWSFYGKHCYQNYQSRKKQTVARNVLDMIYFPREDECTWSESSAIEVISGFDPDEHESDSGQPGTPPLTEITSVQIPVYESDECDNGDYDLSFPEMIDSGSPPGEATIVHISTYEPDKCGNGGHFLSPEHELDESFSENLLARARASEISGVPKKSCGLIAPRPMLDDHESGRHYSDSEDDTLDSEVTISDGEVGDVSRV